MDIKTEKINRINDLTMQQKTGKSWKEWFSALNAAGAKSLSHNAIAAYLFDNCQVNEWWAQMITVGYEQYIGKREPNQRSDGYEISVSKIINTAISTLYTAFATDSIRKTWLSEPITIRKATPNKSMRITWVDETTHVTVNFYEKGENKSQVVVQHSKITDKKTADQLKYFWKTMLEELHRKLN